MRFPLAILALLLASATLAQVQKGVQNGQVLQEDGKVLLTPNVARQMKQSGAQWVRVHFRLIPPYTKWDIALIVKYREAVNNVRSEGLKVLGVLDNESAAGTQSDWTEHSAEAHGGTGDNEYIQRWALDVFRPLMFAFSDVGSWEIWNRPNTWTTNAPGDKDKLPGRSYMYPSNFAWLLKRCFEEARTAKLKVQIVSGGVVFANQEEAASAAAYLLETVRAGVRQAGWAETAGKFKGFPMDAVGVHAYSPNADYSAQLAPIIKVASEMEPRQPRKIWITELGLRDGDDAAKAAHFRLAFDSLAKVPAVGLIIGSGPMEPTEYSRGG